MHTIFVELDVHTYVEGNRISPVPRRIHVNPAQVVLVMAANVETRRQSSELGSLVLMVTGATYFCALDPATVAETLEGIESGIDPATVAEALEGIETLPSCTCGARTTSTDPTAHYVGCDRRTSIERSVRHD
jgi:hypothetical protein